MTHVSQDASRTFVRQMRLLVKNRDATSIEQAVQQMQNWLQAHPDDICVGTALEEFDILAEAARAVAAREKQTVSVL